MDSQLSFLARPADLPEGLRYHPDFLDADEEAALAAYIAAQALKPFEFQGFLGKRRTVSFGWHYAFDGSGLRETEPIEAAGPLRVLEPGEEPFAVICTESQFFPIGTNTGLAFGITDRGGVFPNPADGPGRINGIPVYYAVTSFSVNCGVIPVAGLAKRMEEVYLPGQPEPIRIPRDEEALYLLQQIRASLGHEVHDLELDRLGGADHDGIAYRVLGPVGVAVARLGDVAGVLRRVVEDLAGEVHHGRVLVLTGLLQEAVRFALAETA